MKKHYITPATNTHTLIIETPMLSGSDDTKEQDFGNKDGEYTGDIDSGEGDDVTGI